MIKKLSVIVPAYNEEGLIAGTLRHTAEFLRRAKYEFEILVLNDGSRDKTAQITNDVAREFPEIRLVDHTANRGKGAVVREGVALARYSHCLFMDADNSTRIDEWPAFEKKFDDGFKAVMASRHLRGARIVHPQPVARRLLGGGYRALCRAAFGLRASDFNCGFKAYETSVAKTVYPQVKMTDWTFDVEALCLLKQKGIAVAEVPVAWEHHQKHSDGVIRGPFGTALRTLNSVRELKKRF